MYYKFVYLKKVPLMDDDDTIPFGEEDEMQTGVAKKYT